MDTLSDTSRAQQKLIHKLEAFALELDQGCRSGQIETDRVGQIQEYLSKVASKLGEDQSTDTWLYILHESQALIHWIRSEEDDARSLINSACILKGDSELFTETGKSILGTIPKRKRAKFYTRKQAVSSAVLWMIGWPIIVGGIGFGMLIAGSIVFSSVNMNTPQGFHIRGLWALFVGILVLVCYLLIWLKKRENKPLGAISANVLRTYMWLGIILSVGIMAAIPDPEASAVDAGINVEQTTSLLKPKLGSDPTINAVLAKIGATDTAWVETKFVDGYNDPNLANKAGEYQAFLDTAGNWSYGVLSAKQGVTGAELDSTIAHEYLHHVWFKSVDSETKIRLTSDLIALYGNDVRMRERVEMYASSQILQPTELFSFYCTESSDQYLTPYVLDQCNRYINRSALVFAR